MQAPHSMNELPNDGVEPRKRVAWGDPLIGTSSPAYGRLDLQFEDAFDCACYILSKDVIAKTKVRRYDDLIAYLAERTGYSESQLLSHGQKVRGTLFFVHERLTKADPGKHKIVHAQPPVRVVA